MKNTSAYKSQLEKRRNLYLNQNFNKVSYKDLYDLRKGDHEFETSEGSDGNPQRLNFIGDRIKLMTGLLMSDPNMVRYSEFQLNRFAKKQLYKERNVVQMHDKNMLNLSDDPEDTDIKNALPEDMDVDENQKKLEEFFDKINLD